MDSVHLDELDLEILRCLQQDGRAPFTEIAKKQKVSEGTIRSRVNRMLQEGVFEFIIHIDPEKVGLHTQAIISLSIQMGKQEDVAKELLAHPEVRFVGAFSGAFDLIIQAYFKSNSDLVDFINGRLSKIEGILRAEVSLELKQYKDTFNYVK
jgi:Lrp/AsnC family transcriptional regulator for asnA, asnC and gidA